MTEYYDDTTPSVMAENPSGEYQQKTIVGAGSDSYDGSSTDLKKDDQNSIILFIIGFFTGPIGIFINIYNYYLHRQSPNDTARTIAMLSIVWALLQGVLMGIPIGVFLLCSGPFMIAMIILCCVGCCGGCAANEEGEA